MNSSRTKPTRVLSIDPSTRGFGFTVMEGDASLIDWGVKKVKTNKNERCWMLIDDLIERFQPDAIVVEDFADENCRRRTRVRELIRGIITLAENRGIRSRVFSRKAVRAAFSPARAFTKQEIATAVAQRLPELAPKLPP